MTRSYADEIERLLKEMDALRKKEADIMQQLSAAKIRARDEGIFADSKWFARAKIALRKTRMDIDYHTRSIKLLYKRWEIIERKSVESIFVDVCREGMDPILFDNLLREAQARAKNAQ